MTRRRSLLTGKLTRRTMLRNMGALGLGLAGAGLAGCTTTTSAPTTSVTTAAPTATTPVTGGTFNFGYTKFTQSDPRYGEANTIGHYAAPCFEPLLSLDLDWNTVGVLCTEFTTTDDMTYDVELRENVTFHDGSDFTSTDVSTNFDFLRGLIPDQTMHRYVSWFTPFTSVDIVDSHNLQLGMEAPWPNAVSALSFMNPTYIMKDSETKISDPIELPNGTGPYKLTEYVDGSHMSYERHDDWWGAGEDGFWEGVQYFDDLNYKVVTDDSARVVELENGTVDGIYYQDNPSHMIVLEDDDLDYVSHDDFMVQRMFFNLRREPMSDVRMREAVLSAINFDEVKTVMHPKDSYNADFFANSPYEDANLTYPSYDPDHATDLVEAAVADGIDPTVVFPAAVGAPYMRTGMYASYLELVGINCDVTPQVGPGWIMAIRGANFDIGDGLAMMPAVNVWEFTYMGSYSDAKMSGVDNSNWSGINDPVLDVFTLNIQKSSDPDVIHDDVVSWGERAVEMYYFQQEFHENRTYAFNKAVHGFQGDGSFRRGFPITDCWKET